MALQSSGPIKYSEIETEFGEAIKTSFNTYDVSWSKWSPQTPWVKSSDGVAGWYNSGDPAAWSQFMIDHAVYPSNTDPLVGTHNAIWRIGSTGLPAGTYTLYCQADNSASFTWDETYLGETGGSGPATEWITIFAMGYIANQSYVKLFQGVLTVVYEGTERGTLVLPYLEVGNRRYYGGDLIVDNGNTFVTPSYYELRVDQLSSVTNSHNTSTVFTINNTEVHQHYLTVGVTNDVFVPPTDQIGAQFDENGNLVVTGTGTKTLKLTFGWNDDTSDHGMACGQYEIPGLGVSFLQGKAINPNDLGATEASWYPNGQYIVWKEGDRGSYDSTDPEGVAPKTTTFEVTVTGGSTYDCYITKPQHVLGYHVPNSVGICTRAERGSGVYLTNASNYTNSRSETDWFFRTNNNQRLCFKDSSGEDGNTSVWISEESETVGPYVPQGTSGYRGYYKPNGASGSDSQYNSVLPNYVEEATDTNWRLNPGGVAWELKNSVGTVVRRSSDSFDYDHPGTGWGTLLNDYGVYPSTFATLSNQWHETNYLFTTTASDGDCTIEGIADDEYEFYIDSNSQGESLVLSGSGGFTCNTGECTTSSPLSLPVGTHKLRVRVYNTDDPSNPLMQSWLFNPGGVGFIVRNSSGNIIKTSLDTGGQGSISASSGTVSFGNYRVAETIGGVEHPLDTDAGVDLNVDIPKTGPISFSNFYNARLNMAIDYYTDGNDSGDGNREENARTRYNDGTKVRVVGGFKERIPPTGSSSSTAGKKVIVMINKTFGGQNFNGADSNSCTLRTGSNWDNQTSMRVILGPSARVYGTGGNGGNAGSGPGGGGAGGGDGLSGVGIEYEGVNKTYVVATSGALLTGGHGGGGGGGGAWGDHNERWEDESCSAKGGGGGGGAGLPPGPPGDHSGKGQVPTAGTSVDEGGIGGYRNECSVEDQEVRGGNGGNGGEPSTPAAAGDPGSCRYPNTGGGECNPGGGGAGGGVGAAIRRSSGIEIVVEDAGTITGSQTAIGVA